MRQSLPFNRCWRYAMRSSQLSFTTYRGRRPPEKLWIPRTSLGKQVAEGKVTSMEEIYQKGRGFSNPRL